MVSIDVSTRSPLPPPNFLCNTHTHTVLHSNNECTCLIPKLAHKILWDKTIHWLPSHPGSCMRFSKISWFDLIHIKIAIIISASLCLSLSLSLVLRICSLYPGVFRASAISYRMYDPQKTREKGISTFLKDPLTFLFHELRKFDQFCWSMSNALTLVHLRVGPGEVANGGKPENSSKCCSSPEHFCVTQTAGPGQRQACGTSRW